MIVDQEQDENPIGSIFLAPSSWSQTSFLKTQIQIQAYLGYIGQGAQKLSYFCPSAKKC